VSAKGLLKRYGVDEVCNSIIQLPFTCLNKEAAVSIGKTGADAVHKARAAMCAADAPGN
jgi:hypothetical protein